MENKLKKYGVNYDDFLEYFAINSANVRLDFQCAISLCKNGFSNSFMVLFFNTLFPLSLLAAVVLPFFVSPWYSVVCVIISLFSFRMARHLIVRCSFKELLGAGKQPYEVRERIYSVIVEKGGLFAFQWLNPNDPLGLYSDKVY